MANRIEKTALIETGVELGDNNYIGHFAVIKKGVTIGDGNYIGHHVVIGEMCQHSLNKHELNGFSEDEQHERKVLIGSGNVIREYTTIHMPTTTNCTTIMNNCYIMAYNHISHDTCLHNNVILANNIQIGGHTTIHEFANIGLSSVIHQRSTIGSYAMVGMGTIVTKDIPPFVTVVGTPAKEASKLNEWGLKRYKLGDFIENIINYYNQVLPLDDLPEEIKVHFKNFTEKSKRDNIKIKI